MVIMTIFLLAGVLMFICLIIHNIYLKKLREKEKELYNLQFNTYKSDFSVSKYYERIEQESIKIMQKKYNEPAYILTLWAGNDGLRLNKDGTTEWIKRGEEIKKQDSIDYSMLQNVGNRIASYADCCQTKESQIQLLQSQLQSCCVQQAMQSQYSSIINSIRPTDIQYIPYPYPYYYSPLNQCHNGINL